MLEAIPGEQVEGLLVGLDSGDDAGVLHLSGDLALVQTVDFFPPMVDNPRSFGRIAAANAMSDIYAMGGKPLTTLNLLAFSCSLGMEVLKEIILGAEEKVREAGAVTVGGHSIEDDEPKFGLAVTGVVHPSRVFTNRGAKPGDVLILTKPLGTGILTTALKGNLVTEKDIAKAIEIMTELNREASEAALETGIHACTDVTGFGLAGHLLGMIEGDSVDVELWTDNLPVLPLTQEMAEIGTVPGGQYRNESHFGPSMIWEDGNATFFHDLLFDPQTSGGLLLVLPEKRASRLMEKLQKRGLSQIAIIGRFVEGSGLVKVMPNKESDHGS